MFPYLNSLQHGFRQNRSCVNQMIQYVHFLASTLDFSGQLDTILYLDMAKAFDRVSHQKLLYKQRYLGFRDPLLSWIEDYLTIRRHRVIIEGVASQGNQLRRVSHKVLLSSLYCFLLYLLTPSCTSLPTMQSYVGL